MRCLALVIGALLSFAFQAHAAYPERPIQLIVPFPAGGSTDAVARLVGGALGKQLGTNVVVQNVAGAGGSLGASQAARNAPDGYTLFFGTTGTLSINQSIYPKLPYDAVRDFQPISLVGNSASILLVSASFPPKTLVEFIAYAKEHPGEIAYGSAGVGSSTHLAAALLESAAGIKMLHVPYRGGAAANMDLLAGRISIAFDTLSTGLQFMRANSIRTYGTTGLTRSMPTQDIPTLAEAGLPGFELEIWYALLGPAGLPAAIVERLSAAVKAALAEPDVSTRLKEICVEPRADGPSALAELISKDASKWRTIIKEANISVD